MFHLNGCVVARASAPGAPRGRTCGGWWPLESRLDDRRARELSDDLDLLQMERSGPRVLAEHDVLHEYLALCRALDVRDVRLLVCASPVRTLDAVPAWLETLVREATPLGIDVAYPSGSFSFINGVLAGNCAALAAHLGGCLNPAGLLPREQDVERFVEAYSSMQETCELEAIEDALALHLWESSSCCVERS